jgi:hypothetical protein
MPLNVISKHCYKIGEYLSPEEVREDMTYEDYGKRQGFD